MKMLLVSWNFSPRVGGAERLVEDLFEGISKSHEVVLLTSADRHRKTSSRRIRRSPLPGLLGFLLWLCWALPHHLRQNYQVVMSVNALIGCFVHPWCSIARCPHAVLVFGSDLINKNSMSRRMLRLRLPSVDMVLAISRYVADVAAELGVAKSKIFVLPPSIDPRYALMPSISDDLPVTSRPVLLFVGRVIPRKGLREFLDECLPRICRAVDVDVWIVGDEAKDSLAHRAGEFQRIQKWLANSPLNKRVHCLGMVSDDNLRAAYKAAHLLILPAVPIPGDVEGFGIVFLEAAVFCVPSVSTRLGGISDAVVDGETGFLVDPLDWESYADRVVQLVQDGTLRDALGRQAEERAVRDFSLSRIAARCTDLLSEIAR